MQHHGQHTVEELKYIVESRPEKGLFIYFHGKEPRADAGRPVPCGRRDILMTRALEQYTDLVRRSEIDCDHPVPWLATLVDGVPSESAVSTALQACLHIRTHHHDDISHATGLVEGDGELVAVSESVRDTIAALNSLEMLRHGRQACTPPLTVLENMTQDPVDFVRTSCPRWREEFAELAWRLVVHVAVQAQFKTACMTSLPTLDTLLGFTSPEFSKLFSHGA
ncbi:MAG: hypothetical protein ACKPKO_46120, partial [Candidatus Fonsibacter sp.]